jgi:hypothetical protein
VTDGGDLNPLRGYTDPVSMVVTIDPASDVLAATHVRVSFEISGGRSCAPDCTNPWKNGDPWPLTTSNPLDDWFNRPERPPTESELSAQAARTTKMVLAIVLGVVGVSIPLGLGIYAAVYNRKKKKREREEREYFANLEASEANQGT